MFCIDAGAERERIRAYLHIQLVTRVEWRISRDPNAATRQTVKAILLGVGEERAQIVYDSLRIDEALVPTHG